MNPGTQITRPRTPKFRNKRGRHRFSPGMLSIPFSPTPLSQTIIFLVASLALPLAAQSDSAFFWQKDYSRVLDTGDLQWTPEPFAYEAGDSVRYIDFVGGSDANSGESRDEAWKHHPWDPDARGNARLATHEVNTYVFKNGVIYRGMFRVPGGARGTEEAPIRFTSDPAWGTGMPAVYASEKVSGWQRGAHPAMKDTAGVYYVDLDFLPRTVWMVDRSGGIERLRLARDPAWEESNPGPAKPTGSLPGSMTGRQATPSNSWTESSRSPWPTRQARA